MLDKTTIKIGMFVFVTAIALTAQETKPAAVPHNSERSTDAYKIDYVISEIQDGKRVNARTYTVLVRAGDKANIRLGSRVPFATGPTHEGVSPSFQYLDVGMDMDSVVEKAVDSGVAADSAIALNTVIDVSRAAGDKSGEGRSFLPPVLRSTKIQIRTIVPLGKQTVLTSADEVDGTGKFQVEATATKVR